MYKDDNGLIIHPCANIIEGALFLGAETAGRLELNRTSRFRKSEVAGQFAVEYRLEVTYRPTKSPYLDNYKYSDGPIGQVLRTIDNQARCIVRNYEYIIYADREIPIRDIRDASAFTRRLQRDAYRKKYAIYCIAENFEPSAFIPDYGLVFYDVKLFHELIMQQEETTL